MSTILLFSIAAWAALLLWAIDHPGQPPLRPARIARRPTRRPD